MLCVFVGMTERERDRDGFNITEGNVDVKKAGFEHAHTAHSHPPLPIVMYSVANLALLLQCQTQPPFRGLGPSLTPSLCVLSCWWLR